MVTKSTVNWEKHLADVFGVVKTTYGFRNAMYFIDHYVDRYNEHRRTYVDYKFAILLYDEYKALQRTGTRFWACLGIGGAGKSTIMKNAMYFIDPSIAHDQENRIVTKVSHYLKVVKTFEKDEHKGAFMDEPEDEIHAQSKIGKILRSVAGKWRQHGFAGGICATDVTDIPPYLWKKVHVLFFCPFHGQVWVFQNRPKKLSFPIQRIKKDIMDYGYSLLVSLKPMAEIFYAHKETPLDFGKKQYEKRKWKDYIEDIDRAIHELSQPEQSEANYVRDLKIYELHQSGLKPKTIAKQEGLTFQRVYQILKKFKYSK